MRNTLIRDTYGKFLGDLFEFWSNDDCEEVWIDRKINAEDIRFPYHKENMNGDVYLSYLK